ncbi:uncharacterized protein EI90DRAFT_2324164 [Cantharellus anzutake]|uniref:uncharacterized protein n=1 Tax=Cantharellus anzutake TaxID=1750568 RepID=UPI0019071C97|nr:uncharacterized protein EI90DRAFT_2324164 [Cantharellus anzutake]KAF8324575.1 hypothetical protein EI90DRAFT_2324164 [Cantharellus anzutake]
MSQLPEADANAAQLIYPPHATANAAALANIKFLAACFCGAVAGVLGLENHYGFALFAASSVATALAIYLVHIAGNRAYRDGTSLKGSNDTNRSSKISTFVRGGVWEILNPGHENFFSFILLWTLFYGIVHVYD